MMLKKVQELSNTDEFPKIKNEEIKSNEECLNINGHFAENENYPASQIYVEQKDKYFSPAYFYTIIRDNYIYNIIPVLAKENNNFHSEKEIIKEFPEFISVAPTFNLVDIMRSKPVPPKPRITAPKPAAETKKDEFGRRVCKTKNDHPHKSNKGKGKHLDMECCLDPDEYPNPWCYYDPKKYGKYL